jgi:hypothetical protein
MYLFFWVFPRRQIVKYPNKYKIPKRTNTLFKTWRKFEIMTMKELEEHVCVCESLLQTW